MKQILVILVMLLSLPVLSDEEPSIKDSMRVIGKNFGTLSRALFIQKKVNADHIESAKAIQQSSIEAATKYPATAETPEDKAEYSQMMNQLTKEALNMEKEIEIVLNAGEDPQDLSACTEVYGRMSQLQQDGHDKFR